MHPRRYGFGDAACAGNGRMGYRHFGSLHAGLAVLQILKDSGRDIPFVIYSGVISDQLAFSSMLDGVSDYVPKGKRRAPGSGH